MSSLLREAMISLAEYDQWDQENAARRDKRNQERTERIAQYRQKLAEHARRFAKNVDMPNAIAPEIYQYQIGELREQYIQLGYFLSMMAYDPPET